MLVCNFISIIRFCLPYKADDASSFQSFCPKSLKQLNFYSEEYAIEFYSSLYRSSGSRRFLC